MVRDLEVSRFRIEAKKEWRYFDNVQFGIVHVTLGP